MVPTPEETGRDLFERMDPCLAAQAECTRILYESLGRAKAKLGGNPVKLIGLILDDGCVHPLIKESIIISSSLVGNYDVYYALGGRGLENLYYVKLTQDGLNVQWKEGESVSYKEDKYACLISTKGDIGLEIKRLELEKPSGNSTGVVFFPRRMVEENYSVERLLEMSTVVANHLTFIPLLKGLKRAGGLE